MSVSAQSKPSKPATSPPHPTLRVYNTLSKHKEPFATVQAGKVGIYLCGPTVYDKAHIGHMVGPVIFDCIKRYLTYCGYDVNWVVNITDVDDKLIKKAKERGISMFDVAEENIADYNSNLAALGVDQIDHFPRATECMPEITKFIECLIEQGIAYESDGDVYFDVGKDPEYGKLSNRSIESMQGEGGAGGERKRHVADFALWKAAKPGEPSWESPWGAGRPGWHIECSAMSMKYLGPTFDIHGGGLDLMFPHHENELAQSESATNLPFVKYWLHNGLTKLRTKAAGGQWQATDIHESTGNAAMVRAKDLVATHGAQVIRYLLLSTHYRSPIEFSDEALSNSKKALSVFQRLFERIERISGKRVTEKAPEMDAVAGALIEGQQYAAFAKTVLDRRMQFLERMDDDFNTAGAIAVLHELAGDVNAFIERNDLDRSKTAEPAGAAAAAVQTLRNLGVVLG